MNKSSLKFVVFSLIPLFSLFLFAEALLRIFNFNYSDTPLKIKSYPEEFANSAYETVKVEDGKILFVKDAKQFWIPRPSFEDRHSKEKPSGVTRIATLGDSCTQSCAYTNENYPQLVEDRLNSGGSGKYEVLNAAVGSYSSYQGLQRLKYAVLPYKPDVVTIYFGWNDHWMTQLPDKQIRIKSKWEIRLVNLLEKSRAYQAYHFALSEIKRRAMVSMGNLPVVVRVSIADYESNLREMIRLARESGAKPVLLTAPTDPEQLKPFWNFPFEKEALLDIHRSYNVVVRAVAVLDNVPLIDLEGFLRGQRGKGVFTDGIHFTPEGCRLVAYIVAHQLRHMKVL